MNLPKQIAKHFRDLYFGGTWTAVNLKDSITDVDWKLANRKVYSLNTIATLVFHTNYYVEAVSKVLKGGPLDAKDKYSFDLPPIKSSEDWQKLLDTTWKNAEEFAVLIEELPEDKLGETFSEEKYGTYYRNLHGVIEHTHYHLGQIVLIRKILLQSADDDTA